MIIINENNPNLTYKYSGRPWRSPSGYSKVKCPYYPSIDKEQVDKYLVNAKRDIEIAIEDEHPEVKFTYCYQALLKSGIALLSSKQLKARSVPGHHIKIIESK